MMKRNYLRIWCVTWGVFYVGLMVLNYLFPGTILVKILSCLAIGLNVVYVQICSPKDYLLQIALLFTLLADSLIATEAAVFLSVFVFAFAQFFHFARIRGLEPKIFLIFLITLTVIIYISTLLGLESIVVIGAFYAFFLCANVVSSIMWYLKTHSLQAMLTMCGFILFALCDTCVALSYLSRIELLPMDLYICMDYMSWIFYYPSQVLLANSYSRLVEE